MRLCSGCFQKRPPEDYDSPRAHRCSDCKQATLLKRKARNKIYQKNYHERRRAGEIRTYIGGAHYLALRERYYKLAPGQFNQLLEAQQGKCAICYREMKRPLVDHDHKTGFVRGLLCNSCNTALGKFQDCAEILQRAIVYLQNAKKNAS